MGEGPAGTEAAAAVTEAAATGAGRGMGPAEGHHLQFLSADLVPEAVSQALPGRLVRLYPALVSTDAEARAWARAGAPRGALVVADYQASARGRGGLVWTVAAGAGLCFSLVARPRLSAEREGWLYVVATCAVLDVAGPAAEVEWPDQVLLAGRRAGAVGVSAELDQSGLAWAVVNVLLDEASPPRAPLLARTAAAIEARLEADPPALLEELRPRLRTLGRRLTARLVPVGPAGRVLTGTAVDVLDDGALVLETAGGPRVAVRPQHLGQLEPAT